MRLYSDMHAASLRRSRLHLISGRRDLQTPGLPNMALVQALLTTRCVERRAMDGRYAKYSQQIGIRRDARAFARRRAFARHKATAPTSPCDAATLLAAATAVVRRHSLPLRPPR